MKRTLFTLIILSSLSILSCHKNSVQPDIKQFDQNQIQAYIQANSLTGMQRDVTGGVDTTGIYYQVLAPGSGKPLDYSSRVSIVYTIKTFDGKYSLSDTVTNHYDNYVGHLAPNGFMLAVRNLAKYAGARIRVLVPSHLGYGVNGAGSGSSTTTGTRIAGNQCLDYYVHVISNKDDNDTRQDSYDDLVIRNYLAANNLTGYNKTTSGLYYKILSPGTGTSPITDDSSITTTYTGQLMNNTFFDQSAKTTAATFTVVNLTAGANEALKMITAGGSISFIVPSKLAYGSTTPTGGSIPNDACLRFDFQVATVTP